MDRERKPSPSASGQLINQFIAEQTIEKGYSTYQEVVNFNRDNQLRFGPGVDLIDHLVTSRDLGKIEIDSKRRIIQAKL